MASQILTETVNAIIPPVPKVDDNLKLDGAVIIRVGKPGTNVWNVIQFPANPDEEFTYDVRTTMTQTVGGAFFDDYGFGIPKLVLSGSTAWVSPKGRYNGYPANGYKIALHLYRDIIRYYYNLQKGNANPSNIEMNLYDYTNNTAYKLKPIQPGFSMSRSKAAPLEYQYSCHFAILADLLNDPALPMQNSTDPAKSIIVSLTGPAKAIYNNTTAKATTTAKTVTQAKQQTYTVKSGDTLSKIAQKYYGKTALYTLIVSANKSIKNPNLIYPGQILAIPPAPGANKK